MIVDRLWALRNLGFDPVTTQSPASTNAFLPRGRKPTGQDFQREIIDFDCEASHGQAFLAFTTATGLPRYTEIRWPKGLAPKTGVSPNGTSASPLPKADVLVVTWTVDEGQALSRGFKLPKNDYGGGGST